AQHPLCDLLRAEARLAPTIEDRLDLLEGVVEQVRQGRRREGEGRGVHAIKVTPGQRSRRPPVPKRTAIATSSAAATSETSANPSNARPMITYVAVAPSW